MIRSSIGQPIVPPIGRSLSGGGLPWEGGGGAAPWTPLSLGSKLKLWLDEREQTVTGAGVSSWGDQSSGGGNDFVQATDAERPPTGQTINGWSAPDFDGAADNMTMSTNASAIATTTAWEFFAVYQPDTLGADVLDTVPYTGECLWSTVTGATIGCRVTTSGVKTWIYDGAAYENSPYAAITVGGGRLITGRFNGSTIYCRVGSGTEVSAAAGPAVSSLASALRIGANYNETAWADGKIAALLFCNVVLTDDERSRARTYLAAKYGVTA